MQFDVIIGNPPYQLGQSGGDAVGSFAMPIYHKFVDAAKALEPRYLTWSCRPAGSLAVVDSRSFRQEMLDATGGCVVLVDYPDSREVFPGVDIAGGVSYFLWDRGTWDGQCKVTTHVGGAAGKPAIRYLDEFDIFVRCNEAVAILEHVFGTGGPVCVREHVRAGLTDPAVQYPHEVQRSGKRRRDTDPVLIYQSVGHGFIERGDDPAKHRLGRPVEGLPVAARRASTVGRLTRAARSACFPGSSPVAQARPAPRPTSSLGPSRARRRLATSSPTCAPDSCASSCRCEPTPKTSTARRFASFPDCPWTGSGPTRSLREVRLDRRAGRRDRTAIKPIVPMKTQRR